MDDGDILEAIARELHTGVLVLDHSGCVLYANPFFKKCFPFSGDIKGRAAEEVLGSSVLLKAVEAFKSGQMAHGDARAQYVEIDEMERCLKARFVPIDEGAGQRLFLFLQDITEEKRLEAIKKDFIANVSHELRTPLASIKGYSETLMDGPMDDTATLKEFLGIIDRHATRMSRLINDLLVLSRLESQQLPTDAVTVDLRELITSVTEVFEPQAKDKGLDLTTNFSGAATGVRADRDRLEQVVVNLLDNAIKYTPNSGSVTVDVFDDNANVQIDVKDTGIGIPEKDIHRIFERFYRVDKARSRELGGTGLGLAIVKHIIQGLDGRVWVKSTPGKGSVFSICLKAG